MSTVTAAGRASIVSGQGVRQIDDRRELFVDQWLIEYMEGTELKLHRPVPREVSIIFDRPWEGNTSGYVRVFPDEGRYRMYYRGSSHRVGEKEASPQFTCYAESEDGVHWRKPELGLVEFDDCAKNNIVWDGPGSHNFAPFKDERSDCPPEERYKAVGHAEQEGLLAFCSPDGLHWGLRRPEPIITDGAFDSQNLAFWDELRGRYVAFFRDFREGVRDIKTSTSSDFLQWSEGQWLDYGDAPRQHLYTNAVVSYFRAPHFFVGFPMRFVPERNRLDYPHAGVSDAVFMSSRDGVHWRRWPEAFIRPGLQSEQWVCRNNMIAWGMLLLEPDVPGTPRELSLYVGENYYGREGGARMRRYTLRQDGFVSVSAPYAGGEMLTRPIGLNGRELELNYSTSAAGSLRVELADADGGALEGFALQDCAEMYGDALDEVVQWRGGSDLSTLGGEVVRVRFALKDADLYSLRFRA